MFLEGKRALRIIRSNLRSTGTQGDAGIKRGAEDQAGSGELPEILKDTRLESELPEELLETLKLLDMQLKAGDPETELEILPCKGRPPQESSVAHSRVTHASSYPAV